MLNFIVVSLSAIKPHFRVMTRNVYWLVMVLIVLFQPVTAQYSFNDHFEGDALSDRWIQTAGNSSNYSVANSNLTIENTVDGDFLSPWRFVRFRTPLNATDSLYISSSFSYGRSSYKQFGVRLMNNHDEYVTCFQIWDSPSSWILVSKTLGSPECSIEIPTSYEPHDLEIYRSEGTMFVKWDGTIQWQCAISDTISWLELLFADCPAYNLLTPISIDSIYCYSNEVLDLNPVIQSILIDGDDIAQHVVDHTPLIEWVYTDPTDAKSQEAFEVAVGTDEDWEYAEMWNPAPFYNDDQSVEYAGIELLDGTTYNLRLRIKNAVDWSSWYETSFRMNTAPTPPVQAFPLNYEIVNEEQPTFWLYNSFDGEGDELSYDYAIEVDCVLVAGINIPQQTDSTGWQVYVPLNDNLLHHWYVHAFDGYEHSDWTGFEFFFVNSIEEWPSVFDLTFPPDTGWSQVYDIPTYFIWHESTDPDPQDSVYYKLYVSIDPDFTFTATYDSIYTNPYPVSALLYGTHYWWKVEAIDTKGNTTECSGVADFMTWVLGDANADGAVNLGDAWYIVNYIFFDGETPEPYKVGDFDGDCTVNLGDAGYIINYIFFDGPAPLVGCGTGAIGNQP